jgi:long-chain acyl-CoA synthetase
MGALLEPFAQEHPDATALADEFGETSWRDFDTRVNQLIHALRAAGLEPGDTLSILSGNRREYFEAMAASMQGSYRFVPVNWHWVAEEVAYVLDNSDSKALLVDERYVEVAREALAQANARELKAVIVAGGETSEDMISYEDFIADASKDNPQDQGVGGPMFYTSGTTGRPKGVVSSTFKVGSPVDFMKLVGKSIANSLGVPEAGVTLLEGPIYHSAQWAFAFLPMLAGASVVMRHKFDPAETLELIDQHRVSNVLFVPTQFVRLLRLDEDVKKSFDGSSLEAVWHSAAPCSHPVKRDMIDWFGPVIFECYGSTEGAIISTISSQEWLERPGSLGKLAATIEGRVVKEDGSLAAPGEAGTLYFKNKMGTDFEYHKDPEKTAEVHLEPGVFTFGDVGYIDEDGYLFMSDRKIDMIISGGVNIYPAEIEGVLVEHPSIADAAVFGIPNEEFGEEVKAAVELMEDVEASEGLTAELIAHCREHLAGYKAPRSIDFEASLPRTPTGKLYKRLLRDPYWQDQGRKI